MKAAYRTSSTSLFSMNCADVIFGNQVFLQFVESNIYPLQHTLSRYCLKFPYNPSNGTQSQPFFLIFLLCLIFPVPYSFSPLVSVPSSIQNNLFYFPQYNSKVKLYKFIYFLEALRLFISPINLFVSSNFVPKFSSHKEWIF